MCVVRLTTPSTGQMPRPRNHVLQQTASLSGPAGPTDSLTIINLTASSKSKSLACLLRISLTAVQKSRACFAARSSPLQVVTIIQSRSRFPSHSRNPDPRRGQLLPLLSGIPCLPKDSSSPAWRSSLPILRWKDSLKNRV